VKKLGKALPGRTNIVVTRDPLWRYEDVPVFHSIESAIEYAKSIDAQEVFIGGGGEIYKAALSYADKLYLTLIDDEKIADAFFPEYEQAFTKETFREDHETEDGIKYSFVDLERA
jgi:dihydrofolate reductase